MKEFRSRTDKFFLVKVLVERVQEDGLAKKVVERYAINAIDWAEAQHRTTAYMVGVDMEITDIRPATFSEIIFSDETTEKWFIAKLDFVTMSDSGKEKKTPHSILVPADTLDQASKNIETLMQTSMQDYTKIKVEESDILEVIEVTD